MESKKNESEAQKVGGCHRLGEMREMSDDGQKLQNSSYKVNIFWRSNVQHGDYC